MPENPEEKRLIFIYSLPTIIIFTAAILFSFTQYSKIKWFHLPFHSAIEATGAIIALLLATLLLSSKSEHPHQDFFKISTSAALIGMGTLDLFHSFVEPGQTFVWLHSTATFLGGTLFSLVWFSPKTISNQMRLPVYCLIFSCCFSLLSILFPENIPLMVYEEHNFTLLAKILNLIGGFGFLLGSIWFFKNYYDSSNKQFILFANHCLLFGVAAVIFESSQIWNMQWWLWHATRLFAYFIALSLIFKIYINIEKKKNILLIELQEALTNIKVLRGFLPICASCKKIRDDKGYWYQIESYIKEHSEAEFSHGICPECAEKFYPGMNPYKK